MTTIPNPKPWSVATFELLRPHLTQFVRQEMLPLLEGPCRRILLRAPVKCGKREIVEYVATRDLVNKATRVHAFLSAWHRVADEDQRDELSTQNMAVFSITTQKKVDAFKDWLEIQLGKGKSIVLHLDECDHGTGSTQMLSKVWSKIRCSADITNILYSATPEEVLYSGEVEDQEYQAMMEDIICDGEHVEYTPPEGYCGPSRFLSEGLIHEAIPFFEKVDTNPILTSQAKKIVANLCEGIARNPVRNIIVLRLSYSLEDDTKKDDKVTKKDGKVTKKDGKKNKAIYQFLKDIHLFLELSEFLVVVDKSDTAARYVIQRVKPFNVEKIQWSDPNYWRRQATGVPILLVIDQTCSRSTEWACHDRIFATHDFRKSVQYSTISQAQERVNHYEQRYGGFQPIQVYGNMQTFRLSARQINYSTFLTYEWKKKKIDVRTSPKEMYRILSATNVNHPLCPEEGLIEAEADRLLQELGCYADISLSARVAGSDRLVNTYDSLWKAATKDTWEQVWNDFRNSPENNSSILPARNPFITAESHRLPDGTWQGYHRGWKVLEYDRDVVGDEGWGATKGRRIKVCYRDGELGVAIAYCTGTQQVNTLKAYNSMYADTGIST
jgi:hypothetical protein